MFNITACVKNVRCQDTRVRNALSRARYWSVLVSTTCFSFCSMLYTLLLYCVGDCVMHLCPFCNRRTIKCSRWWW